MTKSLLIGLVLMLVAMLSCALLMVVTAAYVKEKIDEANRHYIAARKVRKKAEREGYLDGMEIAKRRLEK